MSPESLPVKLRQARGAMSLAEAAERSGIPADRIRMYEEGERQPYRKSLRRLADTYGVSAVELVGERDRAARAPAAEARPRPAPRRRRRRRRLPDETATRTIEVPVEVPAGEAIRVVIELVVRPTAAAHPADGAKAAATASDTAPERPVRAPEPAARAPERPAPPRATAVPELRPRPPKPGMAPRHPRVPATSAGGAPPRHPAEPRDPLDGFRQAYREFRREKK